MVELINLFDVFVLNWLLWENSCLFVLFCMMKKLLFWIVRLEGLVLILIVFCVKLGLILVILIFKLICFGFVFLFELDGVDLRFCVCNNCVVNFVWDFLNFIVCEFVRLLLMMLICVFVVCSFVNVVVSVDVKFIFVFLV